MQDDETFVPDESRIMRELMTIEIPDFDYPEGLHPLDGEPLHSLDCDGECMGGCRPDNSWKRDMYAKWGSGVPDMDEHDDELPF